MFGLSVREKLIELIEKAIVQETYVYGAEVKKYCQVESEYPGELPDEISENMAEKSTGLYLDAVANRVYKEVGGASQKTNMRIMAAALSPALCGYPDISVDRQPAGAVYAICYWALKGKVAQPEDCIYLNHAQDACMYWTLVDAAEQWEFKKKQREEWARSPAPSFSYPEGARINIDSEIPAPYSPLGSCSAKELKSLFERGGIVKNDLKNALRGWGLHHPNARITACIIFQYLDRGE